MEDTPGEIQVQNTLYSSGPVIQSDQSCENKDYFFFKTLLINHKTAHHIFILGSICTCLLFIKLLKGPDEIRLVRKQLLSQDFESRVLCAFHAETIESTTMKLYSKSILTLKNWFWFCYLCEKLRPRIILVAWYWTK